MKNLKVFLTEFFVMFAISFVVAFVFGKIVTLFHPDFLQDSIIPLALGVGTGNGIVYGTKGVLKKWKIYLYYYWL